MGEHSPGPQGSLVYVELEIHAQRRLCGQRGHEERRKRAVERGWELAAAVLVSEEVTGGREDHRSGLQRNVPARPKYRLSIRTTGRSRKHFVMPRTMPVGKRKPHTRAWRPMWR